MAQTIGEIAQGEMIERKGFSRWQVIFIHYLHGHYLYQDSDDYCYVREVWCGKVMNDPPFGTKDKTFERLFTLAYGG